MNQTLIANVGDKSVYLMNVQNISFYISVPKTLKSSIVLNLVTDVNLISTNNNMVVLTNQITDLYSKFNVGDVAVVTPILDGNILEQVKLGNDEKVFVYLDKIMGFLINTSYGVLKNNGVEVDNKIKLNNNQVYNNFNSWFVKRYNGRVELVDYNSTPNSIPSGSAANQFVNMTQAPVEKSEASALASDVLDNTTTISTVDIDNGVKPTEVKEPGFVSYVLLGVIVAVVSLVVLYMLL